MILDKIFIFCAFVITLFAPTLVIGFLGVRLLKAVVRNSELSNRLFFGILILLCAVEVFVIYGILIIVGTFGR